MVTSNRLRLRLYGCAKLSKEQNGKLMKYYPESSLRLVIMTILMLLSYHSLASDSLSYDDPFESWNRKVFWFNDTLDAYALKPVAKTYDFVTPKPVQKLVGNFFNNLSEIRNIASASFQLKGGDILVSSGRFLINSTVGILGLIDVATPMGLDKRYSDFGIVLANWGIPSGPYIVLPIFGPNTVRSTLGRIPDSLSNPVTYQNPESDKWMVRSVDVINGRTQLFEVEELILGDRYTFIRDTYLQRRDYLINGHLLEDDF